MRELGLTHLAFERPMASIAQRFLCIKTKSGTRPRLFPWVMGNCRELGAGTHPTHSNSKSFPSCWKCFSVLSVIKASEVGFESPMALRSSEGRTLFCGLWVYPQIPLFVPHPSREFLCPQHFLGTGQCYDHNYLQLIMLSNGMASVPKISVNIR